MESFSRWRYDSSSLYEKPNNLSEEIEEYPELKESIQRFLDNPEMKRYAARELKEARHGNRK
ncbi:hypothetical protein [Neobacillus notoginsengisoli]|uniref:hypothetical protein n=1 Tax=Neobacillus notoginsengisoli TaxID=1578198 RepID=UPI001314A060|nr:hypothetical protein [Neobacillus notoginsengisoli]